MKRCKKIRCCIRDDVLSQKNLMWCKALGVLDRGRVTEGDAKHLRISQDSVVAVHSEVFRVQPRPSSEVHSGKDLSNCLERCTERKFGQIFTSSAHSFRPVGLGRSAAWHSITPSKSDVYRSNSPHCPLALACDGFMLFLMVSSGLDGIVGPFFRPEG